jgi:hypothetical protein
MSQDGVLRTNEFDKMILDASQSGSTIEEAVEAMKAAMRNAPQAAAAVPESAASDPNWEFVETIRWADSQNRRPVIIKAHTAADFEDLKNQILYGK